MIFFALQFITVVTIGGLLGWFLGSMTYRFSFIASLILPALSYLQWIPFLITWALPVWPPREPYVYTFIILIWGLSCMQVMISTFQWYLILRTILELDWPKARLHLIRHMFLMGFFICFISQLWLQPYGWQWFAIYEPNWRERLLINFLMLFGGLVVLNLLLRTDFKETADLSWSVIRRTRSLNSAFAVSGLLVTVLFCLSVWFLLGRVLNNLLGLPPVVDILMEITIMASSFSDSVAYPLMMSLAEVLLGVSIAAGSAVVITQLSNHRSGARQIVELLVPYTFVIPVLISLVALPWPRPLRIAFGVALISIYPCMEVMWRTAIHIGHRAVPIAIDEALPFAFIGMLFGEAMFSTSGVYLLIIQARSHQATTNRAVALAVLIFATLVLLSSCFRWIANRLTIDHLSFTNQV